jgi:hypothetical protein
MLFADIFSIIVEIVEGGILDIPGDVKSNNSSCGNSNQYSDLNDLFFTNPVLQAIN